MLNRESAEVKTNAEAEIIKLLIHYFRENLEFIVSHEIPILQSKNRDLLCVSYGINKFNENSKYSINYPMAFSPGKGYGGIYYLLTARHLAEENIRLKSHTFDKMSNQSYALWQSFVKKNLAREKSLNFEFIDLSQFDWDAIEVKSRECVRSQKIGNQAVEYLRLVIKILKETF